MNWLSRFSDMVKELRLHSQVQLLNYNTFPPVQDSQFNFFEEMYSVEIPKVIQKFYRETNGLQLRWMFKNNEQFSEEKYPINNQILEWDFFQKIFRWEDGGIMILPLKKLLEDKTLDAFSEDYNMIYTADDFGFSISENDDFSNDFLITDFNSYLEFLIAGKGLITRRSFFYARPDFFTKKNPTQILTPKIFWTSDKKLNLDQALLKEEFPFCDQVRFFENKINRTSLQLMSQNGDIISQKDLDNFIEKHHDFLMAGGVGGEWKVLEIRGIVTAFYNHQNEIHEGEQAVFERKNLSNISFKNVELPYSNCCNIFAEGIDFENSNFEKSIFTDSFLKNSNFYNSNLTGIDFSRSDLRNVNFESANLKGADFEECDLRGAKFENLNLEGASFVGAKIL